VYDREGDAARQGASERTRWGAPVDMCIAPGQRARLGA